MQPDKELHQQQQVAGMLTDTAYCETEKTATATHSLLQVGRIRDEDSISNSGCGYHCIDIVTKTAAADP